VVVVKDIFNVSVDVSNFVVVFDVVEDGSFVLSFVLFLLLRFMLFLICIVDGGLIGYSLYWLSDVVLEIYNNFGCCVL